MKSTGVVRKVDQLGRIVPPIELRRSLGVIIGNPMKIFVEDDQIILKKHEADRTCAITGEITDQNVESAYVKGMYLSPKGAEILLKELQSNMQR
ncbi:AbrB/MazE/SpoVT family DNA-binding domain-containing protein [Planococcus donghaensis]|uniref:AbrB/MazE/SpoVT family DNA-binding domain-containing protein n=1 Tax=Planococcus donghaensis TaxID=414778 RepID=UPI003735FB42